MSRFAYAHAAGADWEHCVAACAERIGRPQAGLGFVYFTEALAPQKFTLNILDLQSPVLFMMQRQRMICW